MTRHDEQTGAPPGRHKRVSAAVLEHVGTQAAPYRPNLVLRTPPGTAPFSETAWVGATLTVGDVALSITLPTPRCSVPVAHGALPPDPTALRVVMAENRIDVPGFGVLPAAGGLATAERAGSFTVGDDRHQVTTCPGRGDEPGRASSGAR